MSNVDIFEALILGQTEHEWFMRSLSLRKTPTRTTKISCEVYKSQPRTSKIMSLI